MFHFIEKWYSWKKWASKFLVPYRSFGISICKVKSLLYGLFWGFAYDGCRWNFIVNSWYTPVIIVFTNLWKRIKCLKAYYAFKAIFQPQPVKDLCSINFITVCKYLFHIANSLEIRSQISKINWSPSSCVLMIYRIWRDPYELTILRWGMLNDKFFTIWSGLRFSYGNLPWTKLYKKYLFQVSEAG